MALAFGLCPVVAHADTPTTGQSSDQQIKELQDRIKDLERRLDQPRGPVMPFEYKADPFGNGGGQPRLFLLPSPSSPYLVPPGSAPQTRPFWQAAPAPGQMTLPIPQAPLPPINRNGWKERQFNGQPFYLVPLGGTGSPAR
jgi:hypothetical protein